MKTTKQDCTPVVFRKMKDEGDIIALFPTLPGTANPLTCLSYQTIGQHGSANYDGVMDQSAPVDYMEYAALLKELERCGYRVRIIPRATPQHHEIRKSQIN